MILTQARLQELLDYNPETGHFTWKRGRQGAKRSLQAGSAPNKSGYIQISVDYRIYYAHRLAWLYITGDWPPDQIDHINGERADNRWCNLRTANQSQQSCNSRAKKGTKTRRKGTSFHKGAQKYVAQITHDGINHYLGLFDTLEEAVEARRKAAAVLHGPFARD